MSAPVPAASSGQSIKTPGFAGRYLDPTREVVITFGSWKDDNDDDDDDDVEYRKEVASKLAALPDHGIGSVPRIGPGSSFDSFN